MQPETGKLGCRRPLRVAAMLAAVVAAVAVAPAAEASFPGKNGRIAFVRIDTTGPAVTGGIFTIRSDGTGERQLTAAGLDPAWSPNGQLIAFSRGIENVGPVIHTMRADGTGVRRLRVGSDPSWRSDGRRIVFVGRDDHLRTMNRFGRGVRDLGIVGGEPSWSPDGKRIAFIARTFTPDANIDDVYVLDLASGDVDNVTDGFYDPDEGFANNARTPNWSPDGTRIAFGREGRPLSECTNRIEIHTIRADGTDEQVLARPVTGLYAAWPAWAPAGRGRLVYTSFIEEAEGPECGSSWQQDLVRIGPANVPELLTDTHLGVDELQPDWQPLP